MLYSCQNELQLSHRHNRDHIMCVAVRHSLVPGPGNEARHSHNSER